ncbi:MAG: hypothetical protein IPP71_03310 [Bacteroidetes bacterium]|nr:hypothetical protein [Bacteroidota bacterium]
MKTKIILVGLILFIGVLVFQTIHPESAITSALADTTDVNPNGSSELSKLMRDMQKYTTDAKADIKVGKAPAAYPVGFDKVHTAKISDGVSKSEYYKQFADLYVMAVKNYATSTPETRVETYNNMVSSCLACHSQHCPGPVPVIKKMMLEVK